MKLSKSNAVLIVAASLIAGFAQGETSATGTPTPSTKDSGNRTQVFADTKGNYYGCVPGSQEHGANTSQCSPLPSTVASQIKAAGIKIALFPGLTATTTTQGSGTTSASASGSSTTESVDTEKARVTVSTQDGVLSCPVSAIGSDKSLNPALCVPATNTSEHAKIVCVPPVSTTPLGVPTTTATATAAAAANLICAMPGETYSQKPLPPTNGTCPGGGTRTVVGGFDTKSGEVDVTVTMKDCVDEHGNTHNGTATMQGTLALTTAKAVANPTSTYDMNETKTVSSTVLFKAGGQVSRNCTVTRVGTYDDKTGTFNGTVSRNNCTLKGDYKFHPGLVDNLVENVNQVEPI